MTTFSFTVGAIRAPSSANGWSSCGVELVKATLVDCDFLRRHFAYSHFTGHDAHFYDEPANWKTPSGTMLHKFFLNFSRSIATSIKAGVISSREITSFYAGLTGLVASSYLSFDVSQHTSATISWPLEQGAWTLIASGYGRNNSTAGLHIQNIVHASPAFVVQPASVACRTPSPLNREVHWVSVPSPRLWCLCSS